MTTTGAEMCERVLYTRVEMNLNGGQQRNNTFFLVGSRFTCKSRTVQHEYTQRFRSKTLHTAARVRQQ